MSQPVKLGVRNGQRLTAWNQPLSAGMTARFAPALTDQPLSAGMTARFAPALTGRRCMPRALRYLAFIPRFLLAEFEKNERWWLLPRALLPRCSPSVPRHLFNGHGLTVWRVVQRVHFGDQTTVTGISTSHIPLRHRREDIFNTPRNVLRTRAFSTGP